ncbi:MAG: stage V sporulation protein AD [Oscillospiraceae bacterium]|nr:stage V sporulation protein AD [Oscillospiraceae bacterium]
MESAHRGKQSFVFRQTPAILSFSSVAGKKEADGPLGTSFDKTAKDTTFGQKTWEKAETQMQRTVMELALHKASLREDQLDAAFVGDLLNQCVGSSFCMRDRDIPTFGLYGACSTMAESLMLAAMSVNAGYCRSALALTSSHFASSERQYRFPLAYGGQRTPTAQWTVTGAGAAVVGQTGDGPFLLNATVGSIIDAGIKDAANMGAAMAPAAYETIRAHFDDLGTSPEDYDLIVTGDLGKLGYQLVCDLFARDGVQIEERYRDCGVMIFDCKRQDVHCGGSGCGCSASVLCGHLLGKMRQREISKLLFCGTGALLSPLTTQQGESIPAVCHAVTICTERS